MNLTLLDDTISAIEQCRNGTTGSFGTLNVTVQDPPSLPPQNTTTNSTIERRATELNSSVTWPCPTFLYVGNSSSARNRHLNLRLVVIAGCMGMAYGMAA